MDIFDAVKISNPSRTNKKLWRAIMKISEEAGEVAQAYLSVTSDVNLKKKTWDDVRTEIVDVMFASLDAIVMAMPDEEGLSDKEIKERFYKIFEKKYQKNFEKYQRRNQ